MSQADYPRVMIAAPKRGSGKTSLVCGLLKLLMKTGKRPVSFKCGPDYIDPMFHRRVLGIPSWNLDTFFTDGETVCSLMAAHAGEISVIEGVMGFFDGLGGTSLRASSYEVAAATETPVILVVDVKGMSRSVVPLLKGFAGYGDRKLLRGVILNRVSPMLYPAMKAMIEAETDLAVLGYLPVTPHADWGSRHLGLVQADEITDFRDKIEALSCELEKTLDLEALLAIAAGAPDLPAKTADSRKDVSACLRPDEMPPPVPVRIGVARDEAFTFYYEENLSMLEALGAELVPFSPLRDKAIPDVDGLLFGGGYPELHASVLEANESMRRSVREAALADMPILGECGGFMYLEDSLTLEGRCYQMAGVLTGGTEMKERLVRFGYVTLTAATDEALYLPKGESIRAHEFHYFDSTDNGSAFTAVKPSGRASWPCMRVFRQVLAGYPHLYYASNPAFAAHFVAACRRRKESRTEVIH